MSNLFRGLKPKAVLGKSGFDLSQKHVFSSKSGMLIPCLSLETVPNDHFEIDLAGLTRTMTFNTAAFVRGTFRYDFFFVPYSQLWHPFNQFYNQRPDVHSTTQKSSSFLPKISLGKLLKFASDYRDDSRFNDYFGYDILRSVVRLLDMLGYGNHMYLTSVGKETISAAVYCRSFEDKYINLFRICAYQHIWYDYYRNKYYDLKPTLNSGDSNINDYSWIFNLDWLDCDSFANSVLNIESSDSDVTDTMAIVSNMFMQRYVPWKKDLFTAAMPGTQFGAVSTVDISSSGTVQLTGTASLSATTSTDNNRWHSQSSPSVYMNPNDNVKSASSGRSLITESAAEGASNRAVVHDHIVSGTANINSLGRVQFEQSYFDVLSLKKAEALQKWRQATLRAGNMVGANFNAHFGVEPRFESDNNVVFLGSIDGILQVNSVSATADTSGTINGKVGDLAGVGVSVPKGDKIVYDAKDFGVIMCVQSFTPEAEYDANMIDPANKMMDPFDFYTPEFQNIGLQAVPMSDYDVFQELSGSNNPVLGYAPRYYAYKTAVDKVHGEFSSQRIQMSGQGSVINTRIEGSLRAWVTPRHEYFNRPQPSDYPVRLLESWYVNPTIFDNVFGVQSDSAQNSDYFIHNAYFDVKAIRPMSVLGLPEF